MEPTKMEFWKMISLFKQVIFRFQPLIFQGVGSASYDFPGPTGCEVSITENQVGRLSNTDKKKYDACQTSQPPNAGNQAAQ